MNDLIQLGIISTLCCCYSASQDIYDRENQNGNMGLEHKTVPHARCKLFVFWIFFFQRANHAFLPWMLWGFCAGSRHLMQFRELQGKYLHIETFQYCQTFQCVLLSKGISKNLGSKRRNHKPQTDWLFWNTLQWMGCSSGSGMKPGTGLELVS